MGERNRFTNLADSGQLEQGEEYIPIIDRPIFWGKLCSMEYIFILVYMAVNMTRSNMYLGLLEPWLSDTYPDDPNTPKIVTICTFFIPAGCVFAYVVEKIIHNCGAGRASIVVHLLG